MCSVNCDGSVRLLTFTCPFMVEVESSIVLKKDCMSDPSKSESSM